MPYKTYSEKLKDPRWQKKRLEVLEYHGWKCQECGSGLNDAVPLHVHHIRYIPRAEPWEYAFGYYRVLCAPCHEAAHALVSNMRASDMPDDLDQPDPLCWKCGKPVTNEQGYGYGYRLYWCEPCAVAADLHRQPVPGEPRNAE